MALAQSQLTVGLTEVLVDAEGTGTWRGGVTNRSASASIYLGKTGVSTSTGTELKAGESIPIALGPSDRGLYAISTVANARLDRLGVYS